MNRIMRWITTHLLDYCATTRFGAAVARHKLPEAVQILANQKEAEALRARSHEPWSKGRKGQSLSLLRRALLADASSSRIWLLYAQRLLEVNQPSVALPAVENALDLEPASLVALELLYDMTRTSAEGRRKFDSALDRLAEYAERHDECHGGCLDFAIPHQHQRLLAALAHSGDPFTRAVIKFESLEPHPAGTAVQTTTDSRSELSDGALRIAQAVHALAHGRTAGARMALAGVSPDSYPVESLRRAIRRSAAQEKYGAQANALRLYLKARPRDSWATKKLRLTEQMYAVDSVNALIVRRGFTFPQRNNHPPYRPDRNRCFYLLHNSLPETSNGYATRSHGLLTSLQNSGWGMAAITRPGFPFDIPGFTGADVHANVYVDSVNYSRFTDDVIPKDPVPTYVRHYADGVLQRARAERPFVIHAASNYLNGLAAISVARILGVPSIYEVRGLWEVTRASRNPGWYGSDLYRLMERLETDAARSADVVLAITNALREELIERGVDEKKIVVTPNGVDTSRFMPLDRDNRLAQEIGVDGTTVIGYVGSVLDYEGIGLLIEAAAGLARERSDFRVLIVGDGAERQLFERRAVELGVRDIVIFAGQVAHQDVERYYSLIDIAPFPRLPLPVCEMVSPLKPMEAMAMGKAVIASDVAALSEMVEDGITGLLHKKGDAASLAGGLARLLDDEALRGRLAGGARRWVENKRDWQRLAEDVSRIYRNLGGAPSQIAPAARGGTVSVAREDFRSSPRMRQ
jgi:glycosyltransferase involved in cell wall biosynthesis